MKKEDLEKHGYNKQNIYLGSFVVNKNKYIVSGDIYVKGVFHCHFYDDKIDFRENKHPNKILGKAKTIEELVALENKFVN